MPPWLRSSRNDDSDRVWQVLQNLHTSDPISCVIHGCAPGADNQAMIWADMMPDIKQAPFPADWRTYGRSAGPIRNKRMIVEGKPDLVVAFPGGRGTANMVKQSLNAGIDVMKIDWE